MTKNYANGKIYRIVSKTGKQYVGSTTETLSQRLARHRGYTRDKTNHGISSVQILMEDPQAKIILIENFPCQNNDELRAREQYWIENIEGGCVNKVRAHITPEIEKERLKKYVEENRDKINEYQYEWYQKNIGPSYYTVLNNLFKTPEDLEEEEKIRRQKKHNSDKQYREENREKIHKQTNERYMTDEEHKNRVKERAKNWWAENRERLTARLREKMECECGSITSRGAYNVHLKSAKHQTYLATV